MPYIGWSVLEGLSNLNVLAMKIPAIKILEYLFTTMILSLLKQVFCGGWYLLCSKVVPVPSWTIVTIFKSIISGKFLHRQYSLNYTTDPCIEPFFNPTQGAKFVSVMEPSIMTYPGTAFTSKHHYAVFMKGNTPLTKRLIKSALIDAKNGSLTDMRDMPRYVNMLFIFQPLHFWDYGGLPLKIIRALFDIATIVVLGSGLYLWLPEIKRPRRISIGFPKQNLKY